MCSPRRRRPASAAMVTISTHVARAERYRALAEAHDAVFCTVGTHPHHAAEEPDVPAAEIVALSRHPRCVAIGEAGLDYHYDNSPRDVQATGVPDAHRRGARERPAARHPRPRRRRRHDRDLPRGDGAGRLRRRAALLLLRARASPRSASSSASTSRSRASSPSSARRRCARSPAPFPASACSSRPMRPTSRPSRIAAVRTSRPMWRTRRGCSPTSSASSSTSWRSSTTANFYRLFGKAAAADGVAAGTAAA